MPGVRDAAYLGRIDAAGRDLMKGAPILATAKKWNVSTSSLYRYYQRDSNHRWEPSRPSGSQVSRPCEDEDEEESRPCEGKVSRPSRQLLSPEQESEIAAWGIGQARLGSIPPNVRYNDMAQRMLLAAGTVHEVGISWYLAFMRRHPELPLARAEKIDYKLTDCATTANIRIFFDRLNTPDVRDIPLERFYNCDEMGYGQIHGNDRPVIGDAEDRIKFEQGTWVTFFECVTGTGKLLAPLLIFQDTHVQEQDHGVFDGWRFKISTRGWTSLEIAVVWFEEVFIPHIRAEHGDDKWVVLICDEKYCHANDDILWLCLSNKIWLIHYETHCAHIVQPLDISVFAPLKQQLENHRNSQTVSIGYTSAQEDLLKAYRRARNEVVTTRGVRSAWKSTGIFPRDISKLLGSVVDECSTATARQTRSRMANSTPASSPAKSPARSPVRSPAVSPTRSESVELTSDTHNDSDCENQQLQARVFPTLVKALTDNATRIAELEARVMLLEAGIGGTKSGKSKLTARKSSSIDVRKAKRQLRKMGV